jgi:hypothetical protein
MTSYLVALQIHQIVADLKEHTDQVYQWNVVPVGYQQLILHQS